MGIHDVSGVVGWCLGAHSEVENHVENTYVHHLHTFLPALSRYECNTYVFGTLKSPLWKAV